MKYENCIFCKIAGGEIPATTLYEDDDFRVILDVAPATKGHALIIPKKHYRNLYDLDQQLAGKAMILAQQMTNKLKEALGCAGFNIVQNNEAIAGQTVFHFHIHLIPRYAGDAAGISWKSGQLSEADRDEIVAKLEQV